MPDQMNSTVEPAGTEEFRRILGTGLAAALLLFLVSYFYSAVWVDEVCYTDPAVHLSRGEGFISTVWEGQPASRFFAANSPLHPWLLSGGFRLFGIHRWVMQAMTIVELVLACVILWDAVRRLGVLRTPWARYGFFLITVFSSGSFYAAGFGRYDAVGMLVVALTARLAAVPSCRGRWWGLLLCGAAMPWAGLQITAYGAVFAVLLLAVLRTRIWRGVMAWALGTAIGMVALLGLYRLHGVLDLFNHLAAGRGPVRRGWQSLEGWSVNWAGGIMDPSLMVLVLASVVMGIAAVRHGWRSRVAQGCLLALIAAVWISQAMTQIGRFPLYYAWMAVWPVAACVAAATEAQPDPKAGRRLLAAIVAVALAWFPVWIALAATMSPRRDLAAVEKRVAPVVQPGEVVVGDFASYYALLPRASRVYTDVYILSNELSEAERKSVTLVVVRPASAPAVLRALGGHWIKLPQQLGSINDPPLLLNCWDYKLEVWRPEALTPEQTLKN